MNCKKCKKEIPEGSLYCMWCGAAQKRDKKKSMYQRPDGLFEKVVTIGGRRVPFRGRTEAEVSRKMLEFREVKEKGRLFGDIAEEWQTEHFPTLSPNTEKGYAPAVKRAVEQFGALRASEIKPGDINAFILSFARRGWAQKTVRTQRLVLNLIFNKAVVDGDVEYNPVTSVSIPAHLPKHKREVPSEEEIDCVKRSADCTFGLFAYFLLYTGCRRGEALALRYGDIDFDKKRISITKSLYHVANRPQIKRPKTEAGNREIILLDRLAEKLPKKKKKTDLLFPNEQGELMTETQFQRQWELYTMESGLSITPHQLRHAYATILFEAGVDEKDAQELLGHSSITLTRDVYTHIRSSRKDKTAELLNKL